MFCFFHIYVTSCSFFCDAQVHLSVSQVSVSLSVDCQHVGERPARPLGTLPTEGFEMLGKLVKTRGPNSGSASVACPPWRPSNLLLTDDSCPHQRSVFTPSSHSSPLRLSATPRGLQRTLAATFPEWSVCHSYIEVLVVLAACLTVCCLNVKQDRLFFLSFF